MTRLFGTDGVRGIANKELTPDLAFRLGFAGAQVLTGEKSHKPIILVGTDTRISCGMLESALVAGITSAGADVFLAGVVPTPGIAYLTRKYNCDAGIMISASHNSYEYNGIKFFASTGYKLPDEIEDQIEQVISEYTEDIPRPIADRIGHRIQKPNSARDYAEHLKRRMSVDLSGMKIALDCANGASFHIAPGIFADLGAEVVSIGIEPDGENINLNCGSTHLTRLGQTVRREGCDIGIAFDGDADRMLAIDENGTMVDGDGIIAIIAKGMKERGTLRDHKVCVTVMSNLGLDIFAEQAGITLYKAQVGDRYVLEEMLKSGIVLGGEQSGHIILLEHTTTGDGLLSALALLKTLKFSDQRLSEAHSIMKPLPQVLKNAQIANELKKAALEDEDVKETIVQEEARLKNKGRILVRPSGTEPLIRVMVEGENKKEISIIADRIVDLLTSRYGI
ncbi:MAG TPA: phosphoglucosamine mutase [Clostridiaceae bacterium]|nr:phosphoglucosamine mutase [Clostridiaceae bacterium]